MKGSGEVVGGPIDPKVVDPDDVETLQDLVVGAHRRRRAAVHARTSAQDNRLGPLAGRHGRAGAHCRRL